MSVHYAFDSQIIKLDNMSSPTYVSYVGANLYAAKLLLLFSEFYEKKNDKYLVKKHARSAVFFVKKLLFPGRIHVPFPCFDRIYQL